MGPLQLHGVPHLLGEGAYYAPELTRVFERRGPVFISAMLRDPEKMYPGQRRMWKYDFSENDIADLTAFFQWIGGMDLNGFPPKPVLGQVAVGGASGAATRASRPDIFNQLCLACHKLGGEGGAVGPVLDGVGARLSRERIVTWLHDPPAVKPGTAMPKLPLSEGQIQELAAFLSTQRQGGTP
jgi:nitric oxide reductase subunit C